MKGKNSCWFFIFWSFFSPAQIDEKFVEHLSRSNLKQEHLVYLNSVKAEPDSIGYFYAKFHLKYFNDSLFLDHYSRSKILCQNDSQLLCSAGKNLLLGNKPNSTKLWFTELETKRSFENVNVLQKIYKASLDPNLYAKETFPEELQTSYATYKKYYNKKPGLAAFYSVLVPGLGKHYAGKTKSFLVSFALCAGYALQTIESSRKLGMSHPLTIVDATAFSVFYFSGIYGSYKAIIKQRKEHKKQFIIDATNYYN